MMVWSYEWSEYCEGCVDPYALNFDENAGTYDGTCDYDPEFEDNYTFLGTFDNSSYYHSSNSSNFIGSRRAMMRIVTMVVIWQPLTTEEENTSVSAMTDDIVFIGLYQNLNS